MSVTASTVNPDVCRWTRQVHGVYICLANQTTHVRNQDNSHRLICYIDVPAKRDSDTEEDYKLCMRRAYTHHWKLIYWLFNIWSRGFELQLNGDDHLSLIVPVVGLVQADIIEQRSIMLTSAAFSTRCQTRLASNLSVERDPEGSGGEEDSDSDDPRPMRELPTFDESGLINIAVDAGVSFTVR